MGFRSAAITSSHYNPSCEWYSVATVGGDCTTFSEEILLNNPHMRLRSCASIGDCLGAGRKSVWVVCSGGNRAGKWREVWPFYAEYDQTSAGVPRHMCKFRAFENERETERGRKSDYDMVTVTHAEQFKTAEIHAARLVRMCHTCGPCASP